MIKLFKSLALIINYKTFLVTGISIVATWVCIRYQILADIHLSMVSIAIVFPIVFAINSAYQRREEALKHLAGIKGLIVAIFLAVKHWGDDNRAPHKLLVDIGSGAHEILKEIEKYLMSTDFATYEFGVYNRVSHLSERLQEMRTVLVATEMSRINEYISMILVNFEELKIIREYRTPITLRTYSTAFIYSFPILFAPFFASTINIFTIELITYSIPVMYSFILISLINIQEHMEDPFDGIGEDDIRIELDRFDNLLYELDANHVISARRAVGTGEKAAS